jgi:Cysteine-rich CPCC
MLSEGYGSYDICRVCGWEDDGVQLANPCSGGGANHESLAEAQGAALQELPIEVQKHLGFTRSTEWRPLSPSEVALFQAKRALQHWHSKGITELSDTYWARSPTGVRQ